MALLNRRLKEKPADEVALLIEPEKVVLVDVEDDEDEEIEEETFKHHGITLWVSDAVILIVQHLQIFALILAMSERWGYPFDFIKEVYYVFLVNLDVWEFVKVNSEAYSGSTTSYVKTSNLPFGYQPYFIAWTALFFVTCLAFLGTYINFKVKRPLYLLLHVASLKRVFCVIAQLACIPVGVVIARVFHCRQDGNNGLIWNVDNSVQCWTMPHYVYVAVALVIAIMVFVAYPINLIRKTRGQVISFDPDKHEGYLQLKESEYNQGLDILWAVGQFHLFSSFRRMWIYYRPIIFYLKFFLLCFYAGLMFYPSSLTSHKLALNISIAGLFVIIVFVMLSSSVAKPPISRFRAFVFWFIWKFVKEFLLIVFSVRLDMLLPKFFLVLVAFGAYSIDSSGGGMGFLLSLLIIIMLRSPPFRVTPFNFMIVFCFLVNSGNVYIGCVIERNKFSDVLNPLLVHPYPFYGIIALNSIWLAVAIGWIIYLLLRYYQVIGGKRPLWPTLSRDGKSDMDTETKKYMRAVLRGRHILEKALSSPPIFAPVHEIERQIHVINAYCREAEYLEDPTFESLWDLLDELIEAHRALSPLSMFSQSVKKSVRETSKEFMKLMPQMRKRLDQREHDFILMGPVKKRMLLKMYVLGAFVNGRCDKIRYEVEKKVHKSLEQAAIRPISSVISSVTSTDWDSIYGTKDHYDNDMYGTNSSSGSRPGTSLTSRVDSVDKLLDEVDTWEEDHKTNQPKSAVKAQSIGSLRSTQELSSGQDSSPTGKLFQLGDHFLLVITNKSKDVSYKNKR